MGIKHESIHYAVAIQMDDTDQHIYTWILQILCNLMRHAGFTVRELQPLQSDMIGNSNRFHSTRALQDKNSFSYHWVKGIKA